MKFELSEITLYVLLVLFSLNFGLTALDLAPYSYDLDYSEGFVIEDVNRLLETGELYPDPSVSNGFESVKYPPVYFTILGLIGSLTSVSLPAGRFLNIASTLVSLGLIYLITRHETDSKLSIIPLLFLGSYLTIFTGITIRTDMLGVAFSLAGLYLFISDREIWAVPVFLLAFFTKQTFVAGFAACSVYLLFESGIIERLKELVRRPDKEKLEEMFRDHQTFWIYNTAYLAGLVGINGILALISGSYIENIFTSNVGGFSIRYDLINWMHVTFLPVAGAAAYYISVFKDRLLGIYLTFSLGITFLQLTRGGAWIYAVIEPFAVMVLCTSILYYRAPEIRNVLSLALILQLVIFFHAPLVSGDITDIRKIDDLNTGADRKISGYVQRAESPVFTEYVGFQTVNNRKESPEIWGFYEQYANGRINKEETVSFFRQRNYSYIITYKRLQRLPLKDYLAENYEPVETVKRKDMLLHEENWRVYRWSG